MSPVFPSEWQQRIVEVHGARGAAWLEKLPARLHRWAQQRGWQVEAPFEPLSYNYVARLRSRNGEFGVLKAGVPSAEWHQEVAALQWMQSDATVRIIEVDEAECFLLLEYITPGDSLANGWTVENDIERMTFAARLMPRLWRDGQPSVNFPDVRQWLKALQCSRALTEIFQWEPNLRVLVDEAGVTSEELLNSSGPHVLLHGDYHHGNILRDGNDSWRAIDAKCVWGECEYEAGALLRNPMPWIGQQSDLTHLMQRRVDLLAEESGFERRRIRDWGRVQAVLSAVWTAQDHGTLDQSSLHVAEALGRVEV